MKKTIGYMLSRTKTVFWKVDMDKDDDSLNESWEKEPISNSSRKGNIINFVFILKDSKKLFLTCGY